MVLITCSYRNQEFIRVGYYVNNEYMDEELRLEPPAKPILEKLQRNILADKPRVTRFPIKWDSINELEPPQYIDGAEDEVLSGSVLEEETMMDDDDEVEDDDSETESIGGSAMDMERSPESQRIQVSNDGAKTVVEPFANSSTLPFADQ